MQTHCDVTSRNRGRDITLMLGLRRRKTNKGVSNENGDVARLFFDSFSRRVGIVEDGLKAMSTEVNRLKISVDRSQLSDLVLLERLQKTEGLVRESLNWTKEAAEIWRELNEEGYIRRDQTRIPFRYSLVERVKQNFKKQETRDEEREPISIPQS